MKEYIDKIKYLKTKTKIFLKDVNGKNEYPFDNREDFMKELNKLEESLKDSDNKGIFQIYSSQLLFLKYEDLDRMAKIASRITIVDDCCLYNA